jgi:uncharacterized repeat protein (TIGR01451 family)
MSVEPAEAVFSGATLTYTINYTNTGPATAHNVVISDELPSMLLSPTVSSSGAGISHQSDSRFIWDVDDLEQGQGGTITITAQISPTFNGVIANQASISTSARETIAGDNQAGPVLTNVELPTSVLLISFTASSWPGTILVEWETITDVVGLQGFNLFRSESLDGLRTQLNQELIDPKPHGIDPFVLYQYHDRQVTPGQTYFYWLEIVMGAGVITHGPSTAMATYSIFFPSMVR